MKRVREAAKFVVAIVGAAVNAGLLILVPESAKVWVGIGVAIVTAVSVYGVSNAPAPEHEER